MDEQLLDYFEKQIQKEFEKVVKYITSQDSDLYHELKKYSNQHALIDLCLVFKKRPTGTELEFDVGISNFKNHFLIRSETYSHYGTLLEFGPSVEIEEFTKSNLDEWLKSFELFLDENRSTFQSEVRNII